NKPCVMFTRFLNKRIAICSRFSPRNSAPDLSNWRSDIATSCTGMVSWRPAHRHPAIKFKTQDQPPSERNNANEIRLASSRSFAYLAEKLMQPILLLQNNQPLFLSRSLRRYLLSLPQTFHCPDSNKNPPGDYPR